MEKEGEEVVTQARIVSTSTRCKIKNWRPCLSGILDIERDIGTVGEEIIELRHTLVT